MKLKRLNLSMFRPEQLPMPTTLRASFRDGMAMAQSLVERSAAKLWSAFLTMQATNGGADDFTGRSGTSVHCTVSIRSMELFAPVVTSFAVTTTV